jgi:small-conductance mechanosensitive channel
MDFLDNYQTLLTHAQDLMLTPLFWSQVGVLFLAAPTARLMNFGDNGIELELRVCIQDPEAGIASVRSDINVAIWRAFKTAGIVIPYPQRGLHIVGQGSINAS